MKRNITIKYRVGLIQEFTDVEDYHMEGSFLSMRYADGSVNVEIAELIEDINISPPKQ